MKFSNSEKKHKAGLILILAGVCLLFLQSLTFSAQAAAAPSATPATPPASTAKNYICQPKAIAVGDTNGQANANNTNLATCLNNVYLFSMSIGGFIAVLMFVFAGYLYMTGTSGSISQAKNIITSAIIGLLILFGAYAFLNTLNPSLTNIDAVIIADDSFRCGTSNCLINPQVSQGGGTGTPTEINQSGGPGPGGVAPTTGQQNALNTDGTVGTNSCQTVASGPASAASLQTVFGDNAAKMSAIAFRESGGNPAIPSSVDICADGNPASWGLFQINITANQIGNLNCPSAFSGGAFTSTNKTCRVTDQNLYNQCVSAAKDSQTNIQKAASMSNYGISLGPWAPINSVCGF